MPEFVGELLRRYAGNGYTAGMRFKSCALAVFALSSCTGETSDQAAKCAVYQSFYEYWPAGARPQFRFVRQTLELTASEARAPDQFEPGGLIGDPYNLHAEMFVQDTSGYADQLISEPVAVSDCFPEGGPVFIDESEQLSNRSPDIREVWTFSPVALAPDGRHALLFVRVPSSDYYILFERQGSEWVMIGHRVGRLA